MRMFFPHLLPVSKWRTVYPNLEVGDIVLVYYARKLGPGDYRYGRIVAVKADAKGIVRTATVAMRPRDSRERILPYKSKALVEVELPVQRLVLIHPAKLMEAVATPKLDMRNPWFQTEDADT